MTQSNSLLRQFVDVRKNEAEPALLFFSLWFLLILVFQILRPLKAGLFVENLGAYWELYAKLANIGVAILAVAVFTALYNRLGSLRLVRTLCGFFVVALLLFAFALREGSPSPLTNWLFYLFGDTWSTIWVTTFWAYLNEMTETSQSKRLYGFIGGGGVVGGLVGNLLVWQLVKPFGASILLVGSAIATGLVSLLVWRTEVLAHRPAGAIGRQAAKSSPDDPAVTDHKQTKANAAVEGAKLVMASKYLLSIVMIMFLYELVSQILDYQYKTAAQGLEGEAATQAFLGQVGTIVGVISVVTQFFLVSFVIRKFGITAALLVLPVSMAAASGFYFAAPLLWTGALLTISDNSFNYSINQTARETLFAPTSADVQYKARAFTNMFVQRLGKGAAILMALVLSALPIRFLSVLALAVIAVWAYFAVRAGRHFDILTVKERQAAETSRRAATAEV
jgi:AAA family ATP:ADP antiporter